MYRNTGTDILKRNCLMLNTNIKNKKKNLSDSSISYLFTILNASATLPASQKNLAALPPVGHSSGFHSGLHRSLPHLLTSVVNGWKPECLTVDKHIRLKTVSVV